MKGKLFGIGTGPGDPELLTLKAIKTIKNCDVIAIPQSGEGERTAFAIVEEYLKDKDILPCSFSMDINKDIRIAAREKAANAICSTLDMGKNIGFITLGDPSIYSTYMYIHKIVASKGYDVSIIPGVPSFSAVAAALNTSLCEDDEMLTIIPASHMSNIDELLDLPGNKVIMKSGRKFNDVMDTINKKNLAKNTKVVERCCMSEEKIVHDITDFNGSGYFSIILVKEEF